MIDSTGENGQGKLRSRPGSYILIDRDHAEEHRSHQVLQNHAGSTLYRGAIDKEYLGHWLRGPYSAFTIPSGDTSRVEHNTHQKFGRGNVPCATWHGPLPP